MHIDALTEQFFSLLRTPDRTIFFKTLTTLGDIRTVSILFLAASLWLLYKKKKSLLLALILDLGIAESITFFGKILFHRPRPLHALIMETDYSFPSGHATIAVAFYGFMAFMLLLHMRTVLQKYFVMMGTVIVILLIGVSRLYLGVHYLTDIFAGYIVGTTGLFSGIYFYNKSKKNNNV